MGARRGGSLAMRQTHTLVVLVEDQPGVLNRVVSLMRRRHFNIDSITVGHSEQPGLSRMTIIVSGEDAEVEQAGKQLYKLLEVVKVTDVPAADAITRELVIVKVANGFREDATRRLRRNSLNAGSDLLRERCDAWSASGQDHRHHRLRRPGSRSCAQPARLRPERDCGTARGQQEPGQSLGRGLEGLSLI